MFRKFLTIFVNTTDSSFPPRVIEYKNDQLGRKISVTADFSNGEDEFVSHNSNLSENAKIYAFINYKDATGTNGSITEYTEEELFKGENWKMMGTYSFPLKKLETEAKISYKFELDISAYDGDFIIAFLAIN